MIWTKIWYTIRDTFDIWTAAKASRMSAALAHYTMLSLSPLLVLALAIVGLVYDEASAVDTLLSQIAAFSTPEVVDTVETILTNIVNQQNSVTVGIVSVGVLLFGASGVFSQLYDTLNIIWGVPIDERVGWRYALRQRLLGILMALLMGVLLIAYVLFTAVLATAQTVLNRWLPPQVEAWLEALSRGWPTFFILILVLAALFRLLPAVSMWWRDVWLGSVLTAALFVLNRFLLRLYLEYSTVAAAYGAAGSLVVLLIWIYFTGMILFMGAACCKAYAIHFGSIAHMRDGLLSSDAAVRPVDEIKNAR